jgi:hypothetical protein
MADLKTLERACDEAAKETAEILDEMIALMEQRDLTRDERENFTERHRAAHVREREAAHKLIQARSLADAPRQGSKH